MIFLVLYVFPPVLTTFIAFYLLVFCKEGIEGMFYVFFVSLVISRISFCIVC